MMSGAVVNGDERGCFTAEGEDRMDLCSTSFIFPSKMLLVLVCNRFGTFDH